MSLHRFLAEIRGVEIHCSITSDGPLDAPIFCFSLMAPPEVVFWRNLDTVRRRLRRGSVARYKGRHDASFHFALR